MATHLKRIARATGLTNDECRTAEVVLGAGHSLTRAVSMQHAVTVQLLVSAVAVLVGAAGVLMHVSGAPLVVVAAAMVEGALIVSWAATRRHARNLAHRLIVVGDDEVGVQVVARERRRLASSAVREQLARSLTASYREAREWSRMHPYVPLPGVVQLRHLGREVEDVATLLRGPRARVRGVALTEQLLTDGCSSPLYANDLEALREELHRIRYLLESDDDGSADVRERRAA